MGLIVTAKAPLSVTFVTISEQLKAGKGRHGSEFRDGQRQISPFYPQLTLRIRSDPLS